MSKNLIFVFTGTGNSLWAAKEIAKELEDCKIVSMGSDEQDLLTESYDAIGFVYPTYAGGIPKRVGEFISHVDFKRNKDTYFFAVATCGRISRAQNAISQVRHLLKRKGIKLNYGERLDMFSNYIVGYDMRDTVQEEAQQSAADIRPMIESIKSHRENKGNALLTPRHLTSIGFKLIVANMDKNFNVSDACTKCGICQKVCPVNNIYTNWEEKPSFMHHCEQCLACIQNCPANAINYKDKTQHRKRYMHPAISWKELALLNGSGDK